MGISVKNVKHWIPSNPAVGLCLAAMYLFTPGLVLTAFSGETDAAGMRATGLELIVESPCARLPVPCNILCQEAWSAEHRAAALEDAAEATRSKADMAKKRAVYFQNLAEKRTLEAQKPNKKSYRLVWKSADILLRLIVPKDSRNQNRSDDKTAQSSISRNRKREEKDAAEARMRADEAMITADEAVETAYKAAREAVDARAAADAARSSYEKCPCR